MKRNKHFAPNRIALLAFAVAVSWMQTVPASAQIYSNQYAVVIGINNYKHDDFPDLTYARKDAEGMAVLMQELGYKVYLLTDSLATRENIISLLADSLASHLQKDDAVLFFFAGHGITKLAGGKDRGYIAPCDATSSTASLISMAKLRELSDLMSYAKHQAFIMDCCYDDQLSTRSNNPLKVDKLDIAKNLQAVSRRKARQVLTAGGKDQAIRDDGLGTHSLFTGHLIKGIRERAADTNKDGWVTFNELYNYVSPAASKWNQTPGIAILAGHEQGDFLFRPPLRYALRDTAIDLRTTDVNRMIFRFNFFERVRNPDGEGIKHQYETIERNGERLVIDHTTGLTWQQSGSDNSMNYENAEKYLSGLNERHFAGHDDWRLPTLEEAMSLMEPKKNHDYLYIDPVFDKKQVLIWTADKGFAGLEIWAWGVSFHDGFCGISPLDDISRVRAVRSEQSSIN